MGTTGTIEQAGLAFTPIAPQPFACSPLRDPGIGSRNLDAIATDARDQKLSTLERQTGILVGVYPAP